MSRQLYSPRPLSAERQEQFNRISYWSRVIEAFDTGKERISRWKDLKREAQFWSRRDEEGRLNTLTSRNAWISQVTWGLDILWGGLESLSSPISALLMPSKVSLDSGSEKEPWAIISWLANIFEFWGDVWERIVSWISSQPFSPQLREASRDVGWDLLFEWLTLGAIKWVSGVTSWIKRAWRTSSITEGTWGTIDNSIFRFTRSSNERADKYLEQARSSGMPQLNINEDLFKQDLVDLEIKLQTWSAKRVEVDEFIQRYWIDKVDADYFRTKLETQNSAPALSARTNSASSNRILKNIQNKTYTKIQKRANELGLFNPKTPEANLPVIRRTLEKEFTPTEMRTFDRFQSEDLNFQIVKEAIDTPAWNAFSAELALDLLDRGLVVRNTTRDWFQFTKKAVALIKKKDPTISPDRLWRVEKDWITVNAEDLAIAQSRRDGEIFSSLEADRLYDELRGSGEINRLRELLLEKQTWSQRATIDNDIRATIENINEKFNLGINANEIFDSRTGKINPTKIDEVIDTLVKIRDNEFILYKNIKTPNKAKSLRQKLWFEQRLYKEIFNKWKELWKKLYDEKLVKIRIKHEERLRAITKKYKKDINELELKLATEKLRFRQERAELAMATKNTLEFKKTFTRNLKDWVSQGIYSKKAVTRLENKLYKSNAFNKLDVSKPDTVEKFLKQANEDLLSFQTQAIIFDIGEELKNIKRGGTKSSKKKDRMKLDPVTQDKLLQLKEIYDKWQYNLFELQDILDRLRNIQSKSNEAMIDFELQQNKVAAEIVKKIEEWEINPIEWKADIDYRDTWFLDKAKKYWASNRTWQRFRARTWERIFWDRNSEWYKAVFLKPLQDHDLATKFKSKYFDSAQIAIRDLLWGYEWGFDFIVFMQSIQSITRNWEVVFTWLENIRNARSHAAYFKQSKDKPIPFDEMPKELPFTPEAWASLDWLPIQKLLAEKWGSPAYQKALKVLERFNDELFPMLSKVVERNEGVALNRYKNYLAMPARAIEGDTRMDFQSNDFMNAKVSDWFINDRKIYNNNWEFEYDINFFDLFNREWSKQIDYTFKKDTFEQVKRIFNWRVIKADAAKNLKESVDKWFKLYNKKWDEIEYTKYVDWKLYSETWEIDLAWLEFRIPNTWIKKKLGRTWEKFANQWLDDLAGWGSRNYSESATVVSWVTQFVSKNILSWNISPALKQPLVYFDWVAILWIKRITDAQYEILNNKALKDRLNNVSAIQERVAQPVLQDISWPVKKGKILAGYNKFIDYGLAPMKYLDRITYRNIWYAAYRKALDDEWLSFNWRFDLPDMVARATDEADRIASVAKPMSLPPALSDPISKMMFSILSTQLNRLQLAWDWFRKAKRWYSKADMKEFKQWTNQMLMFIAGNVADAWVSYQLAKILYELWLSTWWGFEESFIDELSQTEDMLRATVGSTIWWGMALSMAEWFDAVPAIGAANSLKETIKAWYERDWEEFVKELLKIVWGRGARYLHSALQD